MSETRVRSFLAPEQLATPTDLSSEDVRIVMVDGLIWMLSEA